MCIEERDKRWHYMRAKGFFWTLDKQNRTINHEKTHSIQKVCKFYCSIIPQLCVHRRKVSSNKFSILYLKDMFLIPTALKMLTKMFQRQEHSYLLFAKIEKTESLLSHPQLSHSHLTFIDQHFVLKMTVSTEMSVRIYMFPFKWKKLLLTLDSYCNLSDIFSYLSLQECHILPYFPPKVPWFWACLWTGLHCWKMKTFPCILPWLQNPGIQQLNFWTAHPEKTRTNEQKTQMNQSCFK